MLACIFSLLDLELMPVITLLTQLKISFKISPNSTWYSTTRVVKDQTSVHRNTTRVPEPLHCHKYHLLLACARQVLSVCRHQHQDCASIQRAVHLMKAVYCHPVVPRSLSPHQHPTSDTLDHYQNSHQ